MSVLVGPKKQLLASMLFFLSLSSLVLAQEPAPPQLLTLDEAVRIAMAQNVDVENARLDVERARASRQALASTRWPLFKAEGKSDVPLNPMHIYIPQGALGKDLNGAQLPTTDIDYQAPYKMTGKVQLTATQALTQLYALSLGVREARVSEKIAEETLRMKRQQTAQQVRDSYYQIAQTQAQIEAALANSKALTENKALMERRLVEEAVLKGDVLTSAAQLAQQNYQTLQLQDGLDTQKESLNRLLARELSAPFAVETVTAPSNEEQDLEAARRKALEQRPEVRIAKLQVEKANYEVRKQRAAYIPDFGAQLGYESFVNYSFAPQNSTSIGFVFSWQPYDWGQKRHLLTGLKSAVKQAELSSSDTARQVLIDVGTQYRKLAEARLMVVAGEANRAAAAEKLRETQNLFAQKAVLPANLLQQQAASVQANTQWCQAVVAFWTAESDFHRALGDE